MSRRQWVAVGAAVVLVAAVVLAILAARADDGSGTGAAASPTTSATPTLSPTPSGSGEPSSSASGPTSGATPSVSGSLAEDGLPQVTITTPTPGAHARIPVHATGTAVAFEAVARYEVLQDGAVFTDGPLYADKGAPDRGTWETDLELPLGEYTLVVFIESPKDGKRIAETRVGFFAG